VGLLAGAGSALAEEAKFTEAGEHEFPVPVGVTSVHVVADGAAGERGQGFPAGAAAEVTSDLNVTPGSTLFVEVGIGGGSAESGEPVFAGKGGGESDVRTCSLADSTCPAVGTAGDPRLVVAGGGGGSGSGGAGGAGGEAGTGVLLTCNPGMNGKLGEFGGSGGFGGGCTSGGAGGPAPAGGKPGGEGTASSGGAGGSNAEHSGGGGGAGYFGGGGGGSNGGPGSGGGGGGGSSFGPTGSSFTTATTAPSVTLTYTAVLPTSKEQCKKGGWKNFGTTFKNQGQCVSFVEHQNHAARLQRRRHDH
jgi:hypothetical protein